VRLALGVATARASQRTEYGADHAAVVAASTQATLGALDCLYLADVVHSWQHRFAVLQRQPDWADLRRTIEAVPARQRERIRRIGRLRRQRIDATHPSTAARIDVVRARPPSAGAIYLTDADDAAITAELLAFTSRSAVTG
jgi:hypothetical protein